MLPLLLGVALRLLAAAVSLMPGKCRKSLR
jgi:hypothetical protein